MGYIIYQFEHTIGHFKIMPDPGFLGHDFVIKVKGDLMSHFNIPKIFWGVHTNTFSSIIWKSCPYAVTG